MLHNKASENCPSKQLHPHKVSKSPSRWSQAGSSREGAPKKWGSHCEGGPSPSGCQLRLRDWWETGQSLHKQDGTEGDRPSNGQALNRGGLCMSTSTLNWALKPIRIGHAEAHGCGCMHSSLRNGTSCECQLLLFNKNWPQRPGSSHRHHGRFV